MFFFLELPAFSIDNSMQGAGNTVFPLLMRNENPELNVYATDYSATAVKVVKVSPCAYYEELQRGEPTNKPCRPTKCTLKPNTGSVPCMPPSGTSPPNLLPLQYHLHQLPHSQEINYLHCQSKSNPLIIFLKASHPALST